MHIYICCLRPITLNNQGKKKFNIKLYKSSGIVAKTQHISLFQDLTHYKKKKTQKKQKSWQHISDNILEIINKTV